MKLLKSPIRLVAAIVGLTTTLGCLHLFGGSSVGGSDSSFPKTAYVTLVAVNSTESAAHFVADPSEPVPADANLVSAGATREVMSTYSYHWGSESSTQEVTVYVISSTYPDYPIGSNSITVSGENSSKKIRAVWNGESLSLSFMSH